MSQTNPATNNKLDELTEDQVADYLQQHSDFFLRQTDLLPHMQVPHDKGNAVSLVERQMTLLREQNKELQEKLDEQHEQAIVNDRSQQRLHKITLNILEATDINLALEELQDSLASLFKLEFSQVRLFADSTHPLENVDPRFIHNSLSARKSLDDFTPTADPVCSALSSNQLMRIFGDTAEEVASNVFIPLRKDLLHGFIALGSKDPDRYAPDMDTIYLKRLSDMVSISLARFIQ